MSSCNNKWPIHFTWWTSTNRWVQCRKDLAWPFTDKEDSGVCLIQGPRLTAVEAQWWTWTFLLAVQTSVRSTPCKCTNRTLMEVLWLITRLCKTIKISRTAKIRCKIWATILRTRKDKTNCRYRSRTFPMWDLTCKTSKITSIINFWQSIMQMCLCLRMLSCNKTIGVMKILRTTAWQQQITILPQVVAWHQEVVTIARDPQIITKLEASSSLALQPVLISWKTDTSQIVSTCPCSDQFNRTCQT